MSDDDLRKALEQYLRGHGRPGVAVTSLRELSGGASCRVYAFELDCGPPALVLRLDRAGGGVQGTRREEHALLDAASRAGVTVPGVHQFGDEADGLGGAFFVMDLVPGEALARRLLRDERYAAARRALPAQLGRELARLHSIDLAQPSLSFLTARAPAGEDPRRYALAEVERYRQILDVMSADQPYPLLRLTARWLEQNAPEVRRPALVHGDFRIGNVMFDERGLTAVLDWELSHVGDPIEDLGWLCVKTWRFGNDSLAAGGLCSREELLGYYEAAGGIGGAWSALSWWELFGNWKWAIICRMQAGRHTAGKWPDVELAAIGRRVAETEQEILSLMESGDGC
ncbi:MAG TPA: phosphotransferase family protein [Candidatus Limnocylindrales bacterium]|nr:phosphotransferase family protein [Candidatus Limnocylindrales bacterium]